MFSFFAHWATLRSLRIVFGFLLLVVAQCSQAEEPSKREILFNRDIRPILSKNCFACHGPDRNKREGNLRLDQESGAKQKLEDHYAIVPGNPEKSSLIERISSQDEFEKMPPTDSQKELSPAEIELLREWVKEGAKYQQHWSLIPPQQPKIPQVKQASWVRNEIDLFILKKIEEANLSPSPRADKVTLLRRLSFDLTGLPPAEELAKPFLQDNSPQAYEQLVDRLLSSPHYGERMAMYWLDLVRYADTVGYHGDQNQAISPYRDYVIHAFNQNMPFDQFTLEQLAGDLLPNATIDQKIASGYNRLLQTSHEGGVQIKEYLTKYDADRIRNLGGVWMGATLGCAECHDHKFDPYTQKDFYSLVAFFADVDDLKTFKGTNTLPTKREPELTVLSPIDREKLQKVQSHVESLEQQLKEHSSSEEVIPKTMRQQLEKELQQAKAQVKHIEATKRRTMVTVSIKPRTIRLLARGDWMDESGEIQTPSVPAAMKPLAVSDRRANRRDLAEWLTSPDHPQTSRVFMNRLWYLLMGEGLSRSLGDAGSQGEWPTHPELLDDLALRFVESKWDVKKMVKLIVMSNCYQQSSLVSQEHQTHDPDNRLFTRQSRYRLPAEMIRDQSLAISGLLVRKIGGESVRPYQPAGYYRPLNFPRRTYKAHTDEKQYRRGVYMHWQRQFLHPMLKAFDAPTREECTPKRPISNTPLSALTTLNDPTFLEAARLFAVRLMKEAPETDSRIQRAFQLALSRSPDREEQQVMKTLFQESWQHYQKTPQEAKELLKVGLAPPSQDLDPSELAGWMTVARAILNLNELLTRN